jgi:anthranilate/para-aminobenzoate synthase component I
MVFGDGRYSFQAGAGIVADSQVEREHDEIIAKSAVMRRAMDLAGSGL